MLMICGLGEGVCIWDMRGKNMAFEGWNSASSMQWDMDFFADWWFMAEVLDNSGFC